MHRRDSSPPLLSLHQVEIDRISSPSRRNSMNPQRHSIRTQEDTRERKKEEHPEDGEEEKRVKWRKTIDQVVYRKSEGYYDNFPIKPGFFFLQSLVKAPAAGLSSLQVNIPATLYYSDHVYMIATGTFHLDEKGRVYCDPDGHFVTLLKLLEAKKPKVQRTVFDSVATVLRFKGAQEGDMKKHAFDWPLFRQKMLAHDLKRCSMMQEFIPSPGTKPSVLRLMYFNSSKQQRANYGFLITTAAASKSETLDLVQRVVLDLHAPYSVDIFKQTGKSLQPYEQAAKSLVEYLQRGYRIRLIDICLDFLRSPEGKIYLCGCKGFTIDPTTSPLAAEMTESFSPYYKPSDDALKWGNIPKPEHSSLGRFVTCKLCRIQHANHELPHLVSLQMLIRFYRHIRRRGKLPYKAVRLKASGIDLLSQTVRICACCYMLVTAEHALIDAEIALAKALNVPVLEEIEVGEEMEPQQFIPKLLRQYRVLVRVEGLETDKTLEYTGILYLRISLGFTVTIFQLEKVVDYLEGKFYSVNGLRLVYFFTAEGKLPKKFLQEVTVKAEVIIGETETGPALLTGSSPLLQTFPASVEQDFALWTTFSLSLFDSSGLQRFPLHLAIGLTNDHVYESAQLSVELRKVLDAYMPEESYYNGDPLPKDWVEKFGPEWKEDSFGTDEKLEDAYGPLIDRGDLDRMQDITSPYPAPLSNKLVVSRPKPKKRHEIPLSASVQHRSLSPSSISLSQLSPTTDAKILGISNLVDSYLTQKPLPFQLSPQFEPKALRRLGKETGEGTKRPMSGWMTGKTSARSVSPADSKPGLIERILHIDPVSAFHVPI